MARLKTKNDVRDLLEKTKRGKKETEEEAGRLVKAAKKMVQSR